MDAVALMAWLITAGAAPAPEVQLTRRPPVDCSPAVLLMSVIVGNEAADRPALMPRRTPARPQPDPRRRAVPCLRLANS